MQKESHDENMKQTWERMSGPSINFTEEMKTEFEIFEENYEEWKTHSYEIINLSAETVTTNIKRQELSELAFKSFGRMRDIIDQLGELIDNELGESISFERRRELESALSGFKWRSGCLPGLCGPASCIKCKNRGRNKSI